MIGDLLYTQEFIRSDGTTTTFDFWYEITNSEDFLDVDITKCSHGFEHSEVGFYSEEDIMGADYRPEKLWEIVGKIEEGGFVQNV